MNRNVYVSSFSVKAPGINTREDLNKLMFNDDYPILDEKNYSPYHKKVLLGTLDLKENSEHYPKRSDQKVMRQDVIAATMCACELFEEAQLSKEDLSNMPLYISNGICVDQGFVKDDFIVLPLNSTTEWKSEKEKMKFYYQGIPPLTALQTLSAATTHFIAQYCGIYGDNTTFGITSQSTYYALEEGFHKIASGENDIVLVGGSNCSGPYSYLTYKNFSEDQSLWKESTCAVVMLLESAESIGRRNAKALCEIKQLKCSKKVPVLYGNYENQMFDELLNENPAEMGIFSGSFTDSEFILQSKATSLVWNQSFSWFEKLGNLGAASVLMNIAGGIRLLEKHSLEYVECVDRDPYSRESYVRICAF